MELKRKDYDFELVKNNFYTVAAPKYKFYKEECEKLSKENEDLKFKLNILLKVYDNDLEKRLKKLEINNLIK